MFTGLIQARGEVIQNSCTNSVGRLVVDIPEMQFSKENYGESIAVNGVCLTLVNAMGSKIEFDLVSSTLELSNIKNLQCSDLVNIEPSAKISDLNGGHMVSGHVDFTAKVLSRNDVGDSVCFKFKLPKGKSRYFVNQGFIALNGASITVYDVNRSEDTFEVWIIPETLLRTNLCKAKLGAEINIEIDQTSKMLTDNIFEAVKLYTSESGEESLGKTASKISELVNKKVALNYSNYFD